MKRLIFNFIFMVFGITSYSQVLNNHSIFDHKILFEANSMMKSFVSKDFDGFINSIYPKFVENVGGKEKMKLELDKALLKLREQGISIDSVIFSNLNPIIKTKEELQTTLIETLIMTIPQGKMINKSTLVCISKDNGGTWFFLDTSSNDLKTMQKQFPNLSDNLIIEKMGKPIVYKK